MIVKTAEYHQTCRSVVREALGNLAEFTQIDRLFDKLRVALSLYDLRTKFSSTQKRLKE